MLRVIEHIVLIALLALVVYLVYWPNPETEAIETKIKELEELKLKEEFIIDSLSHSIEVKESIIDSLFSQRDTIVIETEIIKSRINELPLDSGVLLLRKNLDDYYEMD